MDKTWALVAYTLLTQMSVGTFLVYWLNDLATGRARDREGGRSIHRPLAVIAVLLLLGMVVSLFHLGRPLMAYRAIINVGSSWLSREILFTVVYGLLGLLYIGVVSGRMKLAGWKGALGWLVALSGIGLVYSMSRIYMIEAVPSWNTAATPVAFFAASLLLGGLTAAVVYMTGGSAGGPAVAQARERIATWIGIGSVLLLGVQVGALLLVTGRLAEADMAAVQGTDVLTAVYLILAFVGAGLCGTLLYGRTRQSGGSSNLAGLTYVAFVLVLASQVVHRYLFYVNELRIGL